MLEITYLFIFYFIIVWQTLRNTNFVHSNHNIEAVSSYFPFHKVNFFGKLHITWY